MFILNEGPGEYHGTLKGQRPGTQGSMRLVIAPGQASEVDDETGERLIKDFKGSPLHTFKKLSAAEFKKLAAPAAETESSEPGKPGDPAKADDNAGQGQGAQ